MEPEKPNTPRKKLKRNNVFAANKKNVKNENTFARLVGLLAILLVCGSVAYFAHAYFSVMSSMQQAYRGTGKTSQLVSQRKPISVLILGVDQGIEGRHDRGNSDTMILGTLNPEKKEATMTSIPRDLLADIKGDGPGEGKYYMFRVNSAYQVGGSKGACRTVKTLLNTPVNYYMEVNMKALESMVDALGGVDVNVPFSFTYHTHFKKGKQHLTGKEALDYVRMRKEDPKGDYGRQMRQRQVINDIVQKGLSLNSITNYRKILKVFAKYVRTNLTFDDMLSIAMNYRDCTKNMKSGYIHGHDVWIGSSALQVASTKELRRVSNLVRSSLGLKKETLHNQETRQNSLQEGLDWKNPNAFRNYIIYDKDANIPWDGN